MALDATAERVHAAAAELGKDGLAYTGRQLYYAVCRDLEVPRIRVAPAEVGLGGVLLLLGMIVGALTRQPAVLVALAACGTLLIAAGIVSGVAERRPAADSRPLALSFAAFSAAHLDGSTYPGMLAEVEPTQSSSATAIVLCDRGETVALLRANRHELDAALLIDGVAALSDLPAGLPCVVLHDCSPAGCALYAELRDRGRVVADAGLNPAHVIGQRAQVLEGAPARLPRDLGGHLTAAEVDWLRSGRRVELATLTSREILDRVRAALSAAEVLTSGRG